MGFYGRLRGRMKSHVDNKSPGLWWTAADILEIVADEVSRYGQEKCSDQEELIDMIRGGVAMLRREHARLCEATEKQTGEKGDA